MLPHFGATFYLLLLSGMKYIPGIGIFASILAMLSYTYDHQQLRGSCSEEGMLKKGTHPARPLKLKAYFSLKSAINNFTANN